MRCQRSREVWYVAMALVLFLSPAAFGQTIRSQIAGSVTDETGATLPGVSITLTSPALQVPQIQRVSDERGDYLFVDLPPGSYRLAYELSGFSSIVRQDFRLSTAFAARLDIVMKLSAVAETITVSGESPLIDATNTRGGTTVTKELLQELPTNRNFQDVYVVVGGLQIPGPPLTGGGGQRETGANNTPKTYGQLLQTNSVFEGIVVQSNEIPNFASFDEVDVKSYGNTAEAANPSGSISMIVKSGGNQFHGRYSEFGQNHRFQSGNIDDALRKQGLTVGDAMVWQHDFTGDIGGRIIRNKLWFYFAYKDVRGFRTVPGYVDGPGPDGVYLTGDEPIGMDEEGAPAQTFKVSYQAAPNHKFVGFGSRTPLFEWAQSGSRFVPRETTIRHQEHDFALKPIEWQWVVNNRINVNLLAGRSGYKAIRDLQHGSERLVPTLNLSTGLQTGANFANTAIGTRAPSRPQVIGRIDYFPLNHFLGSHSIQAGYRLQWGSFNTNFPSEPYGNYELIFDTVGGVPNQPVQLATQNRPVAGISQQNLYAVYGSDSWRPGKRLTLNLGLRWDRNTNWVPPQVKVQGNFGSAGSFARVDAGTFSSVSPRLGLAFDLFGDAKTVVKASYGKFQQEWLQYNFNVGFAFDYNQNTISLATYRWHDLNGDGKYQPGEVDLNLNGSDFLSVSGVTNNLLNQNLKAMFTHEVTGSIEHELGRSLSVRGLYVFKRVYNTVGNPNVLIPFSAWNRAITRLDPGPDGVINTADDKGPITFFDFDPAYRGSAFVGNKRTNADSAHYDQFNNVEVTLTKRQTGRWFANASYLATKYHAWLTPVPANPNDLFFPLNTVWELSGRVAAGYRAPFGIDLSTLVQAFNGLPRQRTNLYRAADPSGGPSLPSSGTITLRMEPYGATRGPKRTVVNLRAARTFKSSHRGSLTVDVSAFNLFNSNVPWSTGGGAGTTGEAAGITDASGPTYGFVTRIVNPRIARFGIAYEF